MSKSNRFCFTKNNYVAVDVAILTGVIPEFKYWCFGKEVGEGGTPHLQGYFEFPNNTKVRLSAAQTRVQRLGLMGFHLELAKGTAQQNITYCSKDGDFFQGGDPPRAHQGKRTDLDVVCDAIKDGDNMVDLIDKFPAQVVKFRSGLEYLLQTQRERRFFKTEVWWLWGPTGSGKSRWAWDQEPDAYMKCSTHKWWSGYIGQESVIIDDYRPSKEMPFNFILNLFDRYPLSVETKGGMVEFVAKKIFVTSPYSPSMTCDHLEWVGAEQKAQLIRRVDHCVQFPQLAAMFLGREVQDLSGDNGMERVILDLTQS